MWVQVGAVAVCGGDPTVNRTALELAAAPTGGASTTPQAPAGATVKIHKMLHRFDSVCFGGWDYRETCTFILGFFFKKHLLGLKSETQRRSPLIVFYRNLFTAVNLLHPKPGMQSLP